MVRAAAALALLLALAAAAHAGGERLAIVVGDNAGDSSDVTLRYAESDAARVASALRAGGFAASEVHVLADATASDVRRTIADVRERLQLLVVYYSGHGDAESLHLAGTRLPITELRDLVQAAPAAARVLVVDACRSGALTRVKGGTAAPAFAIRVDAPAAEGLAMLTSSAAGEDAQESDALGASFFSHHFASALLGAADRDRDGAVTVVEAFDYAAARTLASTIATVPGPQHPTYRVALAGRAAIVLARPGAAGTGVLELAEPGSWLVQRDDAVVAELATDAPHGRLALAPGRYRVVVRHTDHLREGTIAIATGAITRVREADLARVAYARVVRKGGTERRTAASAFVTGASGSALLALGTPLRLRAGARLDTPALGYELRATAGTASASNDRHTTETRELALGIAATRSIDRGPLALSAGLVATGGVFLQHFVDPERLPMTIAREPDRHVAFAAFAPLVACDIAAGRRAYLRVEASAPTFITRGATRLAWDVAAGAGVWF